MLPRSARVDEAAEAVGPKAEQAVAHPVDEGAVVEEQVHRRQEAHERREQPQQAEAIESETLARLTHAAGTNR